MSNGGHICGLVRLSATVPTGLICHLTQGVGCYVLEVMRNNSYRDNIDDGDDDDDDDDGGGGGGGDDDNTNNNNDDDDDDDDDDDKNNDK